MFVHRSRRLACLLALGLSGCATVPATPVDDAAADPFEPFNRKVFAVNTSVDRAVIKPVAEAWRSTLPQGVRDSVRSFVDNLREPLIFVNDLLQGRGEAAGISGRRFVINSTWGIAGLFDKAAELGMPRQSGDFGQTLYAWGLRDGPFLMLPLLGPSTVRDAFGLGVDSYAAPFGHIGSDATRTKATIATGVSGGIDLRSRNIESLDAIEASAVDFYAYLRSVWRQNRNTALRETRDAAPADDELVDPGVGAAPPTPASPVTIPLPPR